MKISEINHKTERNPVVSICVLTYNHELFIRKALESFLEQDVCFDVEIILHDDASTDSTADIIRDYNFKYPGLFKLLLQEQNQRSRFGGGMNPRFNYPRARGKYIALCEGDDYWTDPLKLQKQVDFLEGNPDFSGSVHSVIENNGKMCEVRWVNNYCFDLQDVILGGRVGETCSVVYRREVLDSWLFQFNKTIAGDLLFMLAIGYHGKIHGLNDTMGVYRKHNNGISTSIGFLDNFIPQYIELLRFFDQKTDYKYWKLIRERKLELLKEQVKFTSKKTERTKYFINALFMELCLVLKAYYKLLKKL